jgi:hypothetical protein
MGRRLRAAAEVLDPVLVDAGFLPAQYGGPPFEPSSVTFCAAFDRFAARYGHLPQAQQQFGEGRCVDLIIEVDADDTVSRIDLEDHSLEETCRSLGRAHDADVVEVMIGTDVLDSAIALRPILVSLLSPSD